MDARCIKFWEDGQELIKQASENAARLPQAIGKILKELRTISRFLQKNQSSRFSDNAQQKLVDAISFHVSFAKAQAPPKDADATQVLEATFQVVKDGLAMPFNVFGTKQKKRLMKWYNELIGIVGGDPDGLAGMEGLNGADSEAPKPIEWSVLGIDDDGYLSLLQEESGETCETFQVKKKSKEFKQIQKGLEASEVMVITVGDDIQEIRL